MNPTAVREPEPDETPTVLLTPEEVAELSSYYDRLRAGNPPSADEIAAFFLRIGEPDPFLGGK